MNRQERHPKTRYVVMGVILLFAALLHQVPGKFPAQPNAAKAAQRGVNWLIHHQTKDGTWDTAPKLTQGVSACALLALLNAPHPISFETILRTEHYLREQLPHACSSDDATAIQNDLLSLYALAKLEALYPDRNRRATLIKTAEHWINTQQTNENLHSGSADTIDSNQFRSFLILNDLKQLRPGYVQSDHRHVEALLTRRLQTDSGTFPPGTAEANRITALYWLADAFPSPTVAAGSPEEQDRLIRWLADSSKPSYDAGRKTSIQNLIREQNEDGSWQTDPHWSPAAGVAYSTARAILTLSPARY